jgi:hypothetical protein
VTKKRTSVHVDPRTKRLLESLRKRFHPGVEVSAALIVRIALEDLSEALAAVEKAEASRQQRA